VEDCDLPSVNYHHGGAPKVWFVFRSSAAAEIRELVARLFADQDCPDLLRHKDHFISPRIFRDAGIPYDIIVQKPGQHVILFSGAFHMGYNLGPNLCEAANFGSTHWLGSWLRNQADPDTRRCRCEGQLHLQLDTEVLEVTAPPPFF
jgi:hypothetical protein